MLKKAIIGVLALTLAVGIFLGRDTKSYLRTMGKRAQEAVKSEMDLDFELDRAKSMIDDLTPAIQECQEVVIKQQVELARMDVRIAKQEAKLDKSRDEMFALNNDLKAGKDEFRYASMTFSRHDVERDLRIRKDRYDAAEASLNRDKKIMIAQRDKLRANQQTLESMVGQKKELEVAVAQLEARVEQLQAEEAISTIAIDDSQLTRTKQLIQELNEQVDVKEALLEHGASSHAGLIPVGQENDDDDRDISAEIDQMFGGSTEKAENEEMDPAA